jgi:hypothetical protein
VDWPYRVGRSLDWFKMKNPAAQAVKREEEEADATKAKRKPLLNKPEGPPCSQCH